MIIGFTGTQRGMTEPQCITVFRLLRALAVTELHHGWCIGADAEVHLLAKELGIVLVGHPPSDIKKKAPLDINDFTHVRAPYAYLTRNRHIVREGINGLIATPKDFLPPASLRGQDTWTTIGYARAAGRKRWIVVPDGSFRDEK